MSNLDLKELQRAGFSVGQVFEWTKKTGPQTIVDINTFDTIRPTTVLTFKGRGGVWSCADKWLLHEIQQGRTKACEVVG